MLVEIRGLGFEYAELSHGIRQCLVPGILDAVNAGEIRISSVHNFCPLPLGVTRAAPNLYQCSSRYPREQEACWKHTLKTLDMAARVGASVVVLHLGSIEMSAYTPKLLDLVRKGRQDSDKYQRLCAEADEKRESRKEGFLERSIQFLERLVPEAEKFGLKLGIENREKLEEIPFESDFHFLLRRINSRSVVYWHDVGHAQIKENLGFIGHAMHLESLQDHLGGLHIHDVEAPGRDHRAPGTGMVDFNALTPFIRPEAIKVFELSPRLTREEVLQGIQHVQQCWAPMESTHP